MREIEYIGQISDKVSDRDDKRLFEIACFCYNKAVQGHQVLFCGGCYGKVK